MPATHPPPSTPNSQAVPSTVAPAGASDTSASAPAENSQRMTSTHNEIIDAAGTSNNNIANVVSPQPSAATMNNVQQSESLDGAANGGSSLQADLLAQYSTGSSSAAAASSADNTNNNDNEDGDSQEPTGIGGRTQDRPDPCPNMNRALAVSPFRKVGPNMKKGRRVAVKLSKLISCNLTDQQRNSIPKNHPKSSWFYGKIIDGTSKTGYEISMDDFPHDCKVISYVKKSPGAVRAMDKDEEEPPFNYEEYIAGERLNEIDYDGADPNKSKKSPQTRSAEAFMALDNDARATATEYRMMWGEGEEEVVPWDILKDGETAEFPPSAPNRSPFKYEIPVSEGRPGMTDAEAREEGTYWHNYFSHFFPDLDGHAELIDKYHESEKSAYYATVLGKKIKFSDPDAPDPQWKVKACYTLIIAAANEPHNGVNNLWKKGRSIGRSSYPDFGKYVSKDMFKAFCKAAPFVWADEKYWYTDDAFPSWDVLIALLEKFNLKRRELMLVLKILMDEAMSGWRPKTSKTGGLPSITYEKRKPSVDLGTMIRDCVEQNTGILVYQDFCGSPEVQAGKKYFGMESHMPDRSIISKNQAEVLRQIEGAGVEEGGESGGDGETVFVPYIVYVIVSVSWHVLSSRVLTTAIIFIYFNSLNCTAWFGSVATCVEQMVRFKVHGRYIVKNNTSFFPKDALLGVLLARHGNRPAGKWVVMTTEMSGVKLFATAYAWSQKGISFFISTNGSMERSCTPYQSWYENDRGGIECKDLARPKFAEELYASLPEVDSHNKERQHELRLERCWLTKCCWFRHLCTIIGMSVVDENRYYKYKDPVKFGDLTTLELADRIALGLPLRDRASEHISEAADEHLKPMVDKDGSHFREATDAEKKFGKKRVPLSDMCWICKKYVQNGKGYHRTSWVCIHCDTPICLVSHGERSCANEHIHGPDSACRCDGPGNKKSGQFPASHKRKRS